MSIAPLFADLGIVVRSREWSRGGVSNLDGSIFLLVWQDEVKRRDGSNWVFLGSPDNVQTTDNPVLRERLDHIKLLKSGKRGYLIFCDAKWSISGERNISTFNAEKVYPIGDIITNDSGFWAQYLTGILVKELRQTSR
jgi:hypothetical protein